MPSRSATVHRIYADAPISVGDQVSWNGRYTGKVVSVNCETAVVFERNNLALGHSVSWRLRLDALTRIECEC